MAKVRMVDVANAAGVSMTTASYVLNRREVAIPDETRRRVMAAAQSMGYRPNRLARNLARQRSGLIGVIIPVNRSPFSAELAGELTERADRMGYTLVIEPATAQEHGPEAFRQAVERLLQWPVDGLLMWCSRSDPPVRCSCPSVLMGALRSFPERSEHVLIDIYQGALTAARHLVSLGHQRICFVGHDDPLDPRWEALCQVMEDAGLPLPNRLAATDDLQVVRGRVQEEALSPGSATAYFAMSDYHAMAVYRGLRNAGRRIPEDASLISCDESWAGVNMDPPFSALSIPFSETVSVALDFLVQRIAGRGSEPQQRLLVPEFRARASTGPAGLRLDGPLKASAASQQ